MVKTRSQTKSLTQNSKSSSTKRKMASASAIFKDFEDLWDNLTDLGKLASLMLTLGAISVTKFDYNGFDAKAILLAMLVLARKGKKDKRAFFLDLIDIVLVGLTRGNIREDQLGKTVEGEGSERIKELSDFYRIKMKKNASHKLTIAGSEMTFARAPSVVPHIASLLLHKAPRLARRIPNSEFRVNELPAAMQHTGFAGLIPLSVSQDVIDLFSLATLAYMVDFSRMINPESQKMTTKQLLETQLDYLKISCANTLYTEDKKIKFLTTCELHTEEAYNAIVAVAAPVYQLLKGAPLAVEVMRKKVVKNKCIMTLPTSSEQKELVQESKDLLAKIEIAEASEQGEEGDGHIEGGPVSGKSILGI